MGTGSLITVDFDAVVEKGNQAVGVEPQATMLI